MEYKVAVLQINTTETKQDNLECISRLIQEASINGARLISLPETMNVISEENIDVSEPVPGHTTDLLIHLSKKYKIWIHGGSITEYDKKGKPFNTTVMISPVSGIIAKYRKLHLFDVDMEDGPKMKESDRITAGDQIVTVETDIGHLGFAICYDIRFPELFRIMALRGAELIFTPANFTYKTGEAHWESILRCRAIENSCYIIAAGQCGTNKHFQAYGHSMVIDPYGKILEQLESGEGIIYAGVDTDNVKRIREQIPSLNNRRSDIYNLDVTSVF